MGCIEVERKEFMELQQAAITKELPKDFWQQKSLVI